MFTMKKNGPLQEETDFRQPQGPGLRDNSQGFICPMCMEKLKSAVALQVHWESAHRNDFGVSVGTVNVNQKPCRGESYQSEPLTLRTTCNGGRRQ